MTNSPDFAEASKCLAAQANYLQDTGFFETLILIGTVHAEEGVDVAMAVPTGFVNQQMAIRVLRTALRKLIEESGKEEEAP